MSSCVYKVCNFCKLLVIIINAIFLICGIGALGTIIWFRIDKNMIKYLNLIQVDQNNSVIYTFSCILIVVSVCFTLISFLACCGAWKESKCFISLYTISVVILIIIQIFAATLGAIFYDQ
ncbi:hypothetical protein A3Q56_01470, partial [Intoshia linei]